MQSTGNIGNSNLFEASIKQWSLSFIDPSLEKEYQHQRRIFKHISKQMKLFCIIGIIVNLVLTLLDLLSAFVTDPDYKYELADVVFLILYVPVIVCEYFFYRFKSLSIMKGTFFTCFIFCTTFYGASSRFYNAAKYPLISPTVLVWSTFLTFMHTFYVSNWIVTLITYSIVLIEILVIVFVKYGERLVHRTFFYGITNLLYYLFLFIAFIGFSIYSLKTYELKERASFFYESKANQESGKWRTSLNYLPEPVILVQDRVITFYNTATQKFFNLIPEATNAQLLKELNNLVPLNPSKYTIIDLIREPEINTNGEDFSYKSAIGKRHKLQVKHVIVDLGTGPQMTEFIFHDITTVEELEREKTQRYCSSVLVGTASHEIRTPINAIKVVLQTLSEMATNEKEQEEIKIAHVSMDRLELYVKELGILQQLETATLKFRQELFDPNDAVRKIMAHFSYAAKTRGLSLKLYDNSITSITSDKEKYEIIIYHMIENALKYTYEGGISIKFNYFPEEEIFTTSIIDTGSAVFNGQTAGFKLFSPKDDLDFTSPQDINLGRFLADSLAIALGGEVRLESLMGIGTRALVSVKCNFEKINEEDVQEENPIPKSVTMLRKHTWKSLKGILSSMELTKPDIEDIMTSPRKLVIESCNCPKILIVDDESFNVFVLKKFMIDSGLEIDVAINGRIAIESILRRKEECKICRGYKLIFMDINMPVMNGIIAMAKIKELIDNHTIPDVPVIAVTAAVELGEAGMIENYKGYGFKRICNFKFNDSTKTSR